MNVPLTRQCAPTEEAVGAIVQRTADLLMDFDQADPGCPEAYALVGRDAPGWSPCD